MNASSQNLTPFLLIVTLIIWCLSYMWKRRKLYYHAWSVPGPLALPLIGSAYVFFDKPTDTVKKIIALIPRYPDLMRMWFGRQLIYFVTEPEHVEKVLTSQKCLAKHDLYRFMICSTGTGLLTAPTEKWRRQRKIITPSFGRKLLLDTFVNIFVERANVFNEVIESCRDRKDQQLFKRLYQLSFNIICETGAGLKTDILRQQNEYFDLLAHIEKLSEITEMRVCTVWHHFEWTWRFYAKSKEFDKSLTEFRKITSNIIKNKIELVDKEDKHKDNSLLARIEEDETRRNLILLDAILVSSNYTKEELRDEINTFLAAGTETTATTTFFLFTMLGVFSDVQVSARKDFCSDNTTTLSFQQKIYEEVMEILGEDRQVETSDLSNFKYMERVIKETLRLFPVGVLFLRTAEDDIDLGKYVLPKGAGACISVLNIHRNPKYWPDPLRFDPDRFLPEEVAKRHPCTYVPFSYGPRNCVGYRHGMMNMKTVTATVLRKFRVLTDYKSVEDVEVVTKMMLKPKDGFKVYLQLR
ncbi:hypothetical protein NQ315_000185 [Exocentrus adspersus]|uniref:Cytochrome P450 n=1 Tax=Exocentrus adspersus TaxID=1586481 RepID=A0AAV8VQH8_9CUCU|nr:hypothetical protein NQ315_000185 [Exocentrus adspersus]